MYAQLDLEVSCRRPKKKRRPCAPSSQACAPPNRRVRPPQGCAPSPHGCAPPADVRAPHLAGVRALPPQMCAPPSSQACAPYPAGVRALPTVVRNPTPTNARAFVGGGRTRYIRKGPSHPYFTTLGFVSWDSFVGSLQEVVGMVQHFRFLPF
jgi:hypothetical protein